MKRKEGEYSLKALIKLNENQLRVLCEALELYNRLGMAQFDYLEQHPSFVNMDYDMEEMKGILLQLKKKVFPFLSDGEYLGMGNHLVDEKCKISYDILQVLRNKAAYYKNPEGGIEIDFREPRQTSKEELCECEIED